MLGKLSRARRTGDQYHIPCICLVFSRQNCNQPFPLSVIKFYYMAVKHGNQIKPFKITREQMFSEHFKSKMTRNNFTITVGYGK